MKVTTSSVPLKSVSTTIIPYFDDVDKEILELYKSSYGIDITTVVKGSKKEVIVLRVIEKGRSRSLVLLNLGNTINEVQSWTSLAIDHPEIFLEKMQIDLRDPANDDAAKAIAQGLLLSTYDLKLYSTGKEERHPLCSKATSIRLVTEKAKLQAVKASFVETQMITKHQMSIMDLVNGPGNKVNAPFLRNWTKKCAEQYGFKATILTKKQIERKGLDALLAVNRGSEWDPIFIIAEYKGGIKKNMKTLGLVGKGVTFDTGGLSIKGSNNMHYMKSDMGGAAVVLGTIAAVAEQKWPVNIIGLIPVTDNCVDATSIKPGDVIDSYSGKTIEVINTDAEGRLILADGLSYMAEQCGVGHVIDLCTLTGSAVATFGPACAAMMSNDDELADNLISSGLETDEKLWPLPMWEDYNEEMKSDIADIKNLSTRPMAGAITAAKFLEAFVGDHPSWAHLDIAGTAFADTKYGKGKAATGYGVHLLTRFIKDNLLM